MSYPAEDFDPEAMAGEMRALRADNERMRAAWHDFIGKTRGGKNGFWHIPMSEITELGKAFVPPEGE